MTRSAVIEAKKIITMNPVQPVATHFAIRDGRIFGVGSIEDLQAWDISGTDRGFRRKV